MGQGGEVRGHQAGVTDNGHSINSDAVRRKCRLIARRDRYHRLEFASAFAAVGIARDGLLDAGPFFAHRDKCQDTGSRFFWSVPTYRLIELCWATLGRPVGTGNVQWAASGGHPLTVPMRFHSLPPRGTATHAGLF